MDEYQSIKGDERAQVELHVGTQVNFGELKTDVTVRLTCNQDEKTLKRGAELAYTIAKWAVDQVVGTLAVPTPALQQSQPVNPTYGAPRT